MNDDEAKLKAQAILVRGIVINNQVYRPAPMLFEAGKGHACTGCHMRHPRELCDEAWAQRDCNNIIWVPL